MATVTTITYNGIATSITFTSMATLASSLTAGAASLAIVNTANKFVDYMSDVKFVYSANVPIGPVLLGAYASTDGTNFGNPCAGTDSATSLFRPPYFPTNFIPGPGGSLLFPASQIYYCQAIDLAGMATTPTVHITTPSIASCFGSPNVMPQQWGHFIINQSGFAFASQVCTQTGITYTNT